jgi:hydroxyacylglutathione hydrolase
MQPHNTFRIHPQIVQIGCYWGSGGHTELYLLEGDRLALVDTGVNDTPATWIAPALESYGYGLADIALILNTHGHFDHTGGNGPVVAASGAQVLVHEADVPIAIDIDCQFDLYFAQNDLLAGRPDRVEASRATYRRQSDLAPVTRALRDGEVVDLGRGLALRVLSTPGHTAGSVTFVWEREGLALSGDSVMGQGARLGASPLIYNPAAYETTIDQLLGLDVTTLGLGHHYRTSAAPPDSVHYGRDDIRSYLTASREVSDVIGDSLRRAMAELPGAGFLPTAQRATDLLATRLAVTKNEDGLPASGGTAALFGWWQRLGR